MQNLVRHHLGCHLEDVKLQETMLIFDCTSFIGLIVQKFDCFNGNYQYIHDKFSNFLDKLEKCSITPIFVFNGLRTESYDDCLPEKHTKMMRFIQTAKAISEERDYLVAQKQSKFFLPILYEKVITQILEERNICRFSYENNIHKFLSALGIYLNCPVVSAQSDLFLYSHSLLNQGNHYIIMCWDIDFFDENSNENFISCKGFWQKHSPLKEVDYRMLPIAAALLNVRTFDSNYSRLLASSLNLAQNRKSDEYLENIVDFLKFCQENEREGLSKMFKDVPIDQKDNVMMAIIDLYKKFVVPVMEIIEEANIPDKLKNIKQEMYLSTFQSTNDNFYNLSMYMSGFYSSHVIKNNVIQNWTEPMIEAYKNNMFDRTHLRNIYCEGGTFVHYFIQSNSEHSADTSSLPLRRLFYSILYYYQLNHCKEVKIKGVKDNKTKELFYKNSCIYRGEIDLLMLSNTDIKSTTDILNKFINIDMKKGTLDELPAYLHGLMFISTYWIKNGIKTSIFEDNIFINVVVCLAIIFNEFNLRSQRCRYYDREINVRLIELISEMQMIYLSFCNIDILMKVITGSRDFSACYSRSFPSNNMLYKVLSEFKSGKGKMVNYILKRYFKQLGDPEKA